MQDQQIRALRLFGGERRHAEQGIKEGKTVDLYIYPDPYTLAPRLYAYYITRSEGPVAFRLKPKKAKHYAGPTN